MTKKDEKALASAVIETLKRCVETDGDWRLGPVDVVWDERAAMTVIRGALRRAVEMC